MGHTEVDRAARLTPLGVMVLALLRERDMHPYEMIRLLRFRREDRLTRITNGTLYHTVARLHREDLIEEAGVDREGNRPERTTYRLSREGDSVVREWVRRELGRTDRPDTFRVALAEAHNLEREEVRDLLVARRVALCEELSSAREAHAGARERNVSGQFLVEVERQCVLLESELDWLDDLTTRLADQNFGWGFDAAHTVTIERHPV